MATMHNTPFTDMNDSEGEVQAAGYTAFDSGARVVALLTAFIPACSINADRVRANADAACVTVTELADTLVRHEGLSFRQAHEVAAKTARAVIAAEVPLAAGFATFFEAFRTETDRDPAMSDAGFVDAVSLEHFIAGRDRYGGPAPAPMDQALAGYVAHSTTLRRTQTDALSHRADAAARLATAFSSLTEPA